MIQATRGDAYELFHRGTLALSRAEAAGIAIDVPYLERKIDEIESQIARTTERLKSDPIYTRMRRRYGERTKLGSRRQLATIVFSEMGHKSIGQTKTGEIRADAEALETVDSDFVRDWLRNEKYKKLSATYLQGVLNETVNGFLHPFFNLNTVVTYRSSSDTPNFQNIPIRDPEIGRIIRRAFIPRPGRVLVEIDFKGAEVCVGACYHHDANMIRYITDASKDMHRDCAAELFAMRPGDVPKPLRNLVKGAFVFAEFYGSWYKNCAPDLWKGAAGMEYKPGVSVLEHLAKKTGVVELGPCAPPRDGDFPEPEPGTFEARVATFERNFWDKRFPGYRDWKKQWFSDYERRGYFDMLTGFRCSGVYKKNEAVNYPIQGSAFHCLLWSLIELDDWLRRYRLKTKIVGQIHDSMLLDVPEDELADVLGRVQRIITKKLPAAWEWICVPLTVEIEGARTNWFDKKPLAV